MQTLGKIFRAPFDRRAWGQRLSVLAVAYAIVAAYVGVLALVDLVARRFAG